MSALLRLLMPIVIAVVLGPLIAGLAVVLLVIANNMFGNTAALPLADIVKLSGFYIIAAYIIGAPVAFFAGLLVSLWMLARPPSLIVVVGATVIATALYMAIGALGLLGATELTNARSNVLFTLVLAVIAAAVCWLLMRRYMRQA